MGLRGPKPLLTPEEREMRRLKRNRDRYYTSRGLPVPDGDYEPKRRGPRKAADTTPPQAIQGGNPPSAGASVAPAIGSSTTPPLEDWEIAAGAEEPADEVF